MFIPGLVCFEHGVLVHTVVCVGGRQGGGSFRILDAKMQPDAKRHCRKLDLGQQPKPEAGRKYGLGHSRSGDDGTVWMVSGSGQSPILGGYPGASTDISSENPVFEVFY